MCQGLLFKVCQNLGEFKVPLIHRKQVPLLRNTVLILCDEGDGLVVVCDESLKYKIKITHRTFKFRSHEIRNYETTIDLTHNKS